MSGGRSVEVASIGREGAVGGIVSCGHAPAFSRAEVLVGGPGLQGVDGRAGGCQEPLAVHRQPVLPLFGLSAGEVMQSVACNAFHSITERAARWLLHVQIAPATGSS